MKILMVANGMDIGGAETHIIELCRALQARGHKIFVASPEGVYTALLQSCGISTYKMDAFDGSVCSLVKQAHQLKNIILHVMPDVVHAHARPCALICDVLCHALRVTFVTTAHLPFQRKYKCSGLSRWGQGTLAVSQDIAEHLKKYDGVPYRQIKVTVNGIDCRRFFPSQCQEQVKNLVHVSRLDQDRAQTAAMLINIAPQIYKEKRCRQLIIVGDGSEKAILDRSANRINRMLGCDFVVMAGASDHIADILQCCDVFVGVSRAALEAMSCGCPVVLCGNEGYGGFLQPHLLDAFATENFCCRSLAAPTEEILLQDVKYALTLSGEKRNQIGMAMREYVLSHYTPARMAEDAEGVYRSALRINNTPRIIICGYHGYGNLGDEFALKKILPSLCKMAGGVTLLSRTPKQSRKEYGVHAFHRYRLFTLAKLVNKEDILLLTGGNLLQNQTGNLSLAYYLTVAIIVLARGGRVGIMGGGIGEIRGKTAHHVLQRLLAHCSPVLLRTPQDVRLAKQLAPKCHPQCVYDASLMHRFFSSNVKKQPYITVALREPREKNSEKKTALHIHAFCQKHGCRALFLPFHPQKDVAYLFRLAKLVPNSKIVLCASPEKAMDIISRGRCTVTSRLHACYFSLLTGTRCLFFRYDEKAEAHARLLIQQAKRLNISSPVTMLSTMEQICYVSILPSSSESYTRIRNRLSARQSSCFHEVQRELQQDKRHEALPAPPFPRPSKLFSLIHGLKN